MSAPASAEGSLNGKLPNQALFSRLNPLIFRLFYLRHRGRTHAVLPAGRETRIKVRVDSSDALLIWEIWKFNIYRSSKRQPAIRPTDTVLDVGAHIGVFALWAARQAPHGRILAYEASRENFNLLQENIALNQVSNLAAENLAVFDRPGQYTFYQPDGNGALGSLMQDRGARSETVSATTLEEIIETHRLTQIDFFKLDVEGAEYPILLNARPSDLQRVRFIVLEYHEFVNMPWKARDLVDHLSAQGFHVVLEAGIFGQKALFGTGVIKAWRP